MSHNHAHLHSHFTYRERFSFGVLFATGMVLSILGVSAHADNNGAERVKHDYVGVGSCSSTVCHGSVSPRKGSHILHNEYTTWMSYDRHAHAWSALLTPDAKKMGEHLGMAAPEKEPRCLTCHATGDRATHRFAPEREFKDGVGCEACHGAASGYLKSHAQQGATHAQNVANGMHDLASVETRGTLCVSCHSVGPQSGLAHDIFGAGHPRVTFELDTFGKAQPPHWLADDDYRERKGEYIPEKVWFVGALVRARAALRELAQGTGDFSNSSCGSCHHSLAKKQFRSRQYEGTPGTLRPDLSSLLIAQVGARVYLPELASPIAALVATPAEDGLLSKVLTAAESASYPVASRAVVRRSLIELGLSSHGASFEVAEQVAMGLAAMDSAAQQKSAKDTDLKALFRALASPDDFDPAPYQAVLRAMQKR